MKNNTLEAQVGQLAEENKELKEKINQLEKMMTKKNGDNIAMFREILSSMNDTKEIVNTITSKITDLGTRKEGIDAFIEKIKKILPIK